jgi:membrane-associated phospholipid phosphatase
MTLIKKNLISYNPYFFVPFYLWVAAGGLALLQASKITLFFCINGHCTDGTDVFFYYYTWLGQAEVIIPTLLLLMVIPRFRNRWFFFTALACNVIPFLIQHFIKGWLNFPRPMLLFRGMPQVHHLPVWPLLLHSSFPSGHSQGAFSFFCFLSLILPAKYRGFGILLFLLALTVCYSRLYLAAHFFEDVYAGSILGTTLTTVIYSVMERYKSSFSPQTDTFIQ